MIECVIMKRNLRNQYECILTKHENRAAEYTTKSDTTKCNYKGIIVEQTRIERCQCASNRGSRLDHKNISRTDEPISKMIRNSSRYLTPNYWCKDYRYCTAKQATKNMHPHVEAGNILLKYQGLNVNYSRSQVMSKRAS